MNRQKEQVAIIGASPKAHRYANRAMHKLAEAGHHVHLVHPIYKDIAGHKVNTNVNDITEKLDTITMYINAEKSNAIADELVNAQPKRVIFNPGAENPSLSKTLNDAGIETMNACTLVLLSTGQY